MKEPSKDRLEAEVNRWPARSRGDARQTIRAQSVDRFDPPPEVLEKVIGHLKDVGFEVIAQSLNSLYHRLESVVWAAFQNGPRERNA
jgi:fibrillarin-like rRNA methylase